jgi:hypothetical protein
MVLVDLRKGKERNGFLPYSALMDSGATYNFVSQSLADSVGMRPAKARRRQKAVAKLPAIATVNSESLRTTAIVRHMVRMRDSAGVKCCHPINFVIANIASYDIILGMAWLQKQNPDICWDTGIWHLHTRTDAEDEPICLVSAGAIVATMRAERTQAYELHLTDF